MVTIQDQLRAIDFTVNGRSVTANVHVSMMLAELLRDDLGLTGTKVSCDMQVCGACTVLVDERPISACTYLAVDVDGRKVQTVEGLAAPDGTLSTLQQSFIDNFGFQCGFCTPGFLMISTALLHDNGSPTEADVSQYLEGNICRCSGYRPIIASVMAAASGGGAAHDE